MSNNGVCCLATPLCLHLRGKRHAIRHTAFIQDKSARIILETPLYRKIFAMFLKQKYQQSLCAQILENFDFCASILENFETLQNTNNISRLLQISNNPRFNDRIKDELNYYYIYKNGMGLRILIFELREQILFEIQSSDEYATFASYKRSRHRIIKSLFKKSFLETHSN